MRRFFTTTVFLILAVSLFTSACTSSQNGPSAVDGHLDLSDWDFSAGEAKLGGEWQFYWSQQLPPEDFATDAPPEPTGVISLPGVWNRYRVDGERLGPFGVATYRLRVILPETAGDLAVRMNCIYSAYRLWVDGRLVGERGRVGEGREASVADIQDDVYLFPGHGGSAELVLQVANFHLQQGGAPNAILLGYREPLQGRLHRALVLDLIVAGGLLLLGFFFLGRYLVDRRILGRADANCVLFFLVCLLWGGQRLFYGISGHTVLRLWPMSWESFCRLDFIIFYLMPPSLTLLFSGLYPAESLPRLNRVWPAAAGLFTLGTLLTPSAVYSRGFFAYEILTGGQLLYVLWIVARALKRGREGAVPIMAGVAAICITGVNDMLLTAGFIDTPFLTPYGILVLVLSHAYTLSLRSTRARQQVERLGNELGEKNLALERADRLKDEFLANSSHELRTPLNGIIGLAESLRERPWASDEQRRDLDLIAASGRRLANLVNDILDFSRLKNRDLSLNPAPVDLHAAAASVMVFCKPLAGAKSLGLFNDVPADLPMVSADEDRLQQILYNLVGNAIKFTQQGEVRVRAETDNGRVRISVKDTGVGIPEAFRESVFGAFEQVDGSASRRFGGTGLGLGISRKLVELHGGELAFESGPDRGTVFFFSLPVSDVAPALKETDTFLRPRYIDPEPLAPVGEGGGGADGKRVLVVDDDPVNLQVAMNHLTARGIAVTPVTGGREALDLIESGARFDLALLDVMMPGINGFEVCRRLRHRYNSAELPIIMVTARNRLSDLVEGLAQGANDYLTKPFSREELLARTSAQLQVRRAHLAMAANEGLKERLVEREKDLGHIRTRLPGVPEGDDDEFRREKSDPEGEAPPPGVPPETSPVRQWVVELMNRTLDLWVRQTATSKIELARRSGLWKIYMDRDGWERTQTLDRYMVLSTLPKHPRRRVVARTAQYVLEHCPGETDAHLMIRQLIDRL